VTPRAVRIITDVAAVDRPFDYALGENVGAVGAGDRVRVDFNHRSVRGWVLGDVEYHDDLKPLTKWLGFGPPASLLGLLQWASERWCGPLSRLLVSASPRRLVTSLPDLPPARPLSASVMGSVRSFAPGVWCFAPMSDPIELILYAYALGVERDGSLLVLVPTEAWARRLRGRLEQRGCSVASGEDEWDRMRAGWPVVVGSRGTALAPVAKVRGAVIVDADDEAFRSEATPTWDAVTMLRERCARDDAPMWCTTMMPSPSLLDGDDYHVDPDAVGGWPRLVVVDRRHTDPHEGTLSATALEVARAALEGDEPIAVAVILQRLGAGRLLACRSCGELARCAVCSLAEDEQDGWLTCRDGHEHRANFCRSCGATGLRRVKLGVTTLARDVSNQLAQPVSELTSHTPLDVALQRIVVGTEAVFQRIRRCGVVIFVDFDQYLLAPRESARRAAVTAVGKAGRLVGSRRDGRGAVVLQTRRSEDPVLRALEDGDVGGLVSGDVEEARLLSLPPYGAVAEVSGECATSFIQGLAGSPVSVGSDGRTFVVRASDVATLTSALRSVPRPSGRIRLAVR